MQTHIVVRNALGGIMRKTNIVLLVFCTLFVLPLSFSEAQPGALKTAAGMGMRQWRGENRCWKAADLTLSRNKSKDWISST